MGRAVVWSCVLLSLCLFLQEVSSVSRQNFKTCAQSGFCQRNRRLAEQPTPSTYSVVPGSLQLVENALLGNLVDSKTGVNYKFEIQILNDDILRFKMNEANPLNPRYEVKDVLMEDQLKKTGFTFQEGDGIATLGYGKGNNKALKINLSPFRFDVLLNQQEAVVMNKRGLLNFEHSRVKKDEESWEESFNGHTDRQTRGPMSLGVDFSFIGSEHVFGIPEHADDFRLKPTTGRDPYRLYNLDVFEYELKETMALYGSVPYMLSHDSEKTVGVFWMNAAEMWIDVAGPSQGVLNLFSSKQTDTHWFAETGIFDIFFLTSENPKDIFQQYSQLTGKPALPQLFALGYHQCRWNYRDEADVATVNQKFDEHNIPYDVIWLDIEHTDGKKYFTWDGIHFPNPAKMQDGIAKHGRKMVTIIDPHIKRDPGYHIHNEAQSAGLYVKTPEGNNFEGWCWPGSSSYLDFTNPVVREFWSNKFAYTSYQGSTKNLFTWNDMNEPSVFDGPEVTMKKELIHHENFEHRDIHNQYGQYQLMATAEGQIRRNSDRNERPFVLSRAFFAGTQRYGAIWTGDNLAAWDHLEVAQHMLLSLQVTGIIFSGADVGGFYKHPDGELMSRWYQAGAFHPFFRGHAHIDSPRREPWTYTEPHFSHIRKAIQIRYNFLPYWYTLFHQASVSGIPVMRPFWAEFPRDSNTFALQDQFLVGGSILVKPIVRASITSTNIYFPEGIWYPYFESGQPIHGPTSQDVAAPADYTPVYIRGGGIIPQKLRLRRSSSQMQNDPFTLLVALDGNGKASGDLYIDDGHTFDYQTGTYFLANYTFESNQLKSTHVGGSYKPTNFVERVVVLGVKQQPTKVTSSSSSLEFEWSGERLVVKNPGFPIVSNWNLQIIY